MSTSLLRRACAEGIGTYALVTAGCGAIKVNTQTGALARLDEWALHFKRYTAHL